MRKLIFIMAVALISSCNNDITYISDEDFSKTIKMKKSLGIDALINDVTRMIRTGDEVVVQNYRDSAMFCVYNYKSGELVHSWGYRGRADNEYLFPEIFQLNDGKFGINDMGKTKMEFYDDFTSQPSSVTKYEKLPMSVNEICYLYGNEYVFFDDTPSKLTLCKWKVGEEPTPLPSLDYYAEKYSESHSYIGFLGTNRADKIVYAFNFIDGFDMFDAEGNLTKRVRRKDSNGISTFTGYEDNEQDEDFRIFSFRIYTDYDGFYIYRVNSTNSELNKSLERTTYIEQFDWEGHPVRRYELPMFVRHFCPLGDGKFMVYDITSENEALQIFEPDDTTN